MSMQWTAAVLCIAAVTLAAGLVTETSTSNKPPFSFACGSGAVGGSSTSLCSGDRNRSYTQIESIEIYRDYTNQVKGCLEPEKDYVISLLSDWFNYECKKQERGEDSIKIPIQMLQDAMAKYCKLDSPTVSRIVVNYECVKNLTDVKVVSIVPSRPPWNETIPVEVGTNRTTQEKPSGQAIQPANPRPVEPRPVEPRPVEPRPVEEPVNKTLSENKEVPQEGSGLSTIELVLAICIPIVVFLILMAVLLWFCLCYRGRSGGRKESVSSTLGASRSSTAFLVPGAYKGAGDVDELSGAVYGRSSAANDYVSYPGDAGRRSIDSRGGEYSTVYDGVHRPSQASRGGGGGDDGALPLTPFGNAVDIGEPSSGAGYAMALGRGVDVADAPTSRRSSADPAESGGFYDRRLSDRQLVMHQRHPSVETSGSLSTSVIDNRKLSRTSYAELPGDRRSSSGSNFASPPPAGERKISLLFGSAEERRISDGLQQQQQQPTPGGRRSTTFGGPGMPEIRESRESVAGDSVFYSGASRSIGISPSAVADADAARYDGAPTPHHLGPPGRMSWAGETETDTNYSYWPPEWQRWLKNRPSAV